MVAYTCNPEDLMPSSELHGHCTHCAHYTQTHIQIKKSKEIFKEGKEIERWLRD